MSEFFGFAAELLHKGQAKVGNTYAEAELYDFLVQDQADAKFYVELAQRQGGRVLDLACGSGRLLPHLLDAGLDVVGLDLAPEMLARAQERVGAKTEKLQLIEGDMRTFSLSEQFSTIMIPYCSLMYMHNDEERKQVFKNCYDHLQPGGYLAFDFLAGSVTLSEDWPSLALQGIHPFTEEILLQVVQIKGLASDLRLLNQISYTIAPDQAKTEITIFSSKEAVVQPSRITELLLEIGFTIEGVYNDYRGEKYNGGEECLIVAQIPYAEEDSFANYKR